MRTEQSGIVSDEVKSVSSVIDYGGTGRSGNDSPPEPMASTKGKQNKREAMWNEDGHTNR